MLQFPKNYFQDETVDGFHIEAMMKCAWAAQLEVLEALRELCEEYQITYFADWGTLLGAVRHQGFIPWDDDMDLAIVSFYSLLQLLNGLPIALSQTVINHSP